MNAQHTETINIEGMSCNHCVETLTKSLAPIEGLNVHAIEIGSANVSYDPSKVERSLIVKAITDQGFRIQQT